MPPVDDLDRLVLAFRAGKEAAFSALVEATELEVRAFVAAHAFSLDTIDEVVQMVYVTAFQRIAHYRPEATFLAWLKGIARNCLHQELRQHRRLINTGSNQELESWVLERASCGLEEDPAEDETRDRLHRLDHCLGRLSERSRELLRRRYQERLSVAELARELRKTQAATAKVLQRLVQVLRKCMRREETAS